MSKYDDDIAKASDQAEHMRNGGPNNVLWLLVQGLRWCGSVLIVVNGKLDALLARPTGGGSTDTGGIMAKIEDVLAAVTAIEGDTANVERVLGELNTQIAALTQQVADLQAAGAATPEQLQSVVDALNAADATLDTLAPPAP